MASMVAAWPTVALGEVLRVVSRPTPVRADQMYSLLGMHWYAEGLYIKDRKLGSQIQANTLYEVRTGDFVYNRLFGWKGSFGIADETVSGCHVSNEFPCFQIDETRVCPAFLRWYFGQEPVWEHVQSQSSGSTPTSRLRLKEAQFLALTIPLPPLEEQRRIVARIEALGGRIAEARGLRQAARAEASQLMSSAIADALSSQIPQAGDVTVESVACSVTDGDHQPPPKAEAGVPFLFISNVVQGRIDMTGCKWVTPDYFNSLSPTRIPERGDVLYTAVGSYGVPCLVDTDEPFCFQRHIAVIKPNRQRIAPEYLCWALASPSVFEQATGWATGSAQLTVPLSAIRRLRFPLPNLPEQRRIIAYLDSIRSHAAAFKQWQAESAAELDALMPSILDRAFRGEL